MEDVALAGNSSGLRSKYELINLGASLGQGGEGSVYHVVGSPGVAAKLYRKPDEAKALKLQHLVAMDKPKLRKACAWPQSLLTNDTDDIVGYEMELLEGWVPLFSAYQTRTRLKTMPRASWAYLVRIARNLATCVHYVHEEGLVIGDLNESNVLVDRHGIARIIDVDSFQVGGMPCAVGKSELTPPELQGIGLDGLVRTQNHDLFSLAVLVFQTLVLGRHPFAGRSSEVTERTLEENISFGAYVWTTRRDTGLETPPSLNPTWLPPDLLELFERAFDPFEKSRPSALEFYKSLELLESACISCPGNPGHVFWRGATKCPWCDLGEAWGIRIFPTSAVAREPNFEDKWFDVEKVWSEIEEVERPNVIDPPEVLHYEDCDPLQLRWFERGGTLISFGTWLVVYISIRLLITIGGGEAPSLIAIVSVLMLATIFMSIRFVYRRNLGRSVKVSDFEALTKRLNAHLQAWRDTGLMKFKGKFDELKLAKEKYQDIDSRVDQAKFEILCNANSAEIDNFLQRFSTLASGLVNPALKTVLDRHNVTHASHCTRMRLSMVGSVNHTDARALAEWRDGLVRHYVSLSNIQLSSEQTNLLSMMIRKENADLRKILTSGAADLRALGPELERKQREVIGDAQADICAYEEAAPLFNALVESQSIKIPDPSVLQIQRI